jgi:pimeloyl-ACP methyl ester carboxylesterase
MTTHCFVLLHGDLKMKKRLALLILSLLFSITAMNVWAHEEWAKNKDGSVVTNVLTASFDPFGQSSGRAVTPFPTNLGFFTTRDLTLDTPVDDPNDYSDPRVSLNALDGYSLVEKWITGFAANPTGAYDNNTPGLIDPTTVTTGQSVRMFEVTTSQFLFVTSIVRELTPGVDYVAVPASASQIAILPLKPLKEYTSYMAVLTNDIRDTEGNDATPDRTYNFGKTSVPWVDSQGNSTNALFDNATAAQVELIRQVVQSMELNAATYGIDPDDIVLAWTASTQSVTRTLKTLRAFAQPAPTTIVPTGSDTSAIGGLGAADIYMGIITLPYYCGVPSEANPIAPLTDFWKAAPGAYVPPFDQFGLDPTSTNITVANPIPVLTDMQTVPVLMSVPNANSGQTKPATGWPVVIFQHGIFGNRVQALTIADTMAAAGYAVVAIDLPMHGISPDTNPELGPFYIENTPFAPLANERSFDADYLNNETNTPGPDGLIDQPGVIVIPAALSSMLTGRDTLRQGVADLSVLTLSIPTMDIDGDTVPDLDGSNIAFTGLSWGSVHGTAFTAIEPMVTRSFLSVPGGGIARFAAASDVIGPQINSLLASVGIEPGTANYETFLIVWQTVLDSFDPINWSAEAAANTPIMLHEVIGDLWIPNYVPTAPLSGTEPMIRTMGLNAYSTSQASSDGLRSAARFVPPADHGQLDSPEPSPAAFFEMQRQMASFIASHGGAIVVTDESTMVPVMQMQQAGPVANLTEKKGSESADEKRKPAQIFRLGTVNRFEQVRNPRQPDRFE